MRTARTMAMSSLSYMERASVMVDKAWLKYAMGLYYCIKIASIFTLEASISITNSYSKLGRMRIDSDNIAYIRLLKAC